MLSGNFELAPISDGGPRFERRARVPKSIAFLQDPARRYEVVHDLDKQVKRMWEEVVGREEEREQRAWEAAAARLLVAVCQASPSDPAARDFNCG
jgi:hypothetical protein